MPRVSIIIPIFNRAHTIERALASVLSQTFQDWEILLVDDGSTDQSADVARRFLASAMDRLRVIQQTNQGPAAARNRGVAEATGELIAFLDSDDEWLPAHLASAVAFLDTNPTIGLVFSDMEDWRADGTHIPSFVKTKRAYQMLKREPGNVPDLFALLIEENFIPTPTVVLRKSVWDATGGFKVSLRCSEDRHLWMRCSQRAGIAFLPQVSMRRFVSSDSLSLDWLAVCLSRAEVLEEIRELNPSYYQANKNNLMQRAAGYRWSAGQIYMDRGQMAAARTQLAKSLAHRPTFKTGVYWVASLLGAGPLGFLSGMKRLFSRGVDHG